MNLLCNTLVAYKLVSSFKKERWAGRPFKTKGRELSVRTVTISICLLKWFVNDAMNPNIVGNKCLKRIFRFVQNHFQYLIQIVQLRGGGFTSLHRIDRSGEFLWDAFCISAYICVERKKKKSPQDHSHEAFEGIFISCIADLVTSIVVLTLP